MNGVHADAAHELVELDDQLRQERRALDGALKLHTVAVNVRLRRLGVVHEHEGLRRRHGRVVGKRVQVTVQGPVSDDRGRKRDPDRAGGH